MMSRTATLMSLTPACARRSTAAARTSSGRASRFLKISSNV